MKLTLSVIKADVGSIGGHTKPSERMLALARERIKNAVADKLLIDGMVSHTGDDIALIMSHAHGINATPIHQFAWNIFLAATREAQKSGLYGAGQDLLADAPAGNIRGAGPAVAEIEFEHDFKRPDRPAEAFTVFAADKCGPGAYNFPLYAAFCDPMHDGGLLLNPKMRRGFRVTIIDMDAKPRNTTSAVPPHAAEHRTDVAEVDIRGEDGDRIITLDAPERIWDIAVLLQNPDRFAIEAIRSRYAPEEQIASVSATRLHNIAGKYTGKDDPVALVRTQGMFPAPEEITEPFMLGHFVTGDARGSHVMPIMPVALNTAVTGAYCLPLVSAAGFSVDAAGKFSEEYIDFFGNVAWDATRLKIQQKADEWRRQGFIGPTMASHAELSYTGITDALATLDQEFTVRKTAVQTTSPTSEVL